MTSWWYFCMACAGEQTGDLASFMAAHAHGLSSEQWAEAKTTRIDSVWSIIELPDGMAWAKTDGEEVKDVFKHRAWILCKNVA